MHEKCVNDTECKIIKLMQNIENLAKYLQTLNSLKAIDTKAALRLS